MLEIVQFKNGNYAVRKDTWFHGYQFASRTNRACWKDADAPRHMYECPTLQEAESIMAGFEDIGTPIKDA